LISICFIRSDFVVHCETAGNMDRGPQLGHAVVELGNGGLLAQLDIADEPDLRVIAVREAVGFRRTDVGHVADGAGLDQRANRRGAQRAGPAGDDHMTLAIVHRPLLCC
jgi:hypothetical protein